MKDDSTYEMFKFTGNNEFTFDVDLSGLPCGFNGALYFVSMDADGGLKKYPTNKAGAKYGTGYCDAQCPRDLKACTHPCARCVYLRPILTSCLYSSSTAR